MIIRLTVVSLVAAIGAIALLSGCACAATTSTNVDVPITHGVSTGLCVGVPQIALDKSVYARGETIIASATCGAGNAKDSVGVITDAGEVGPFSGTYLSYFGVSTSSATMPLRAPNAIFDRDQQYRVRWFANDGFVQVATSLPFTVRATITPAAPAASLPAALAADPFVPTHALTVCASGCDYGSLGDATDAAFNAGWDNTEVKISCGEYDYPAHRLGSNYPPHLWIKGVCADGVTRPHIFGVTGSSASIIGSATPYATGAGSLTLDNLEIGPWNYWALKQTDGSTWTLRNIYVRDTVQGFMSGNKTDFTLRIYNSVFSRNGGSNGPEHDVYIGEGAGSNTVTVVNSVFDQPVVGHAFKERAKFFNATCSMFAVNEDDFYLGSETIDMDSGQPHMDKILSVNGGGAPKSWTDNSSWDNIRYGADNESNIQPLAPALSDSLLIADQPNSWHWFFTLGSPLASRESWSGNKFVWPDAGSRQPGSGGTNAQDATGALDSLHSGNTSDVTLDGTNLFSVGRGAAGLPAVGTYPKGWRDYLPLMPAACTDPVGLVKVPTN